MIYRYPSPGLIEWELENCVLKLRFFSPILCNSFRIQDTSNIETNLHCVQTKAISSILWIWLTRRPEVLSSSSLFRFYVYYTYCKPWPKSFFNRSISYWSDSFMDFSIGSKNNNLFVWYNETIKVVNEWWLEPINIRSSNEVINTIMAT